MRSVTRMIAVGLLALTVGNLGCLQTEPATELIAGAIGVRTIAENASVNVLAPQGDLALPGGTPVEATYRVQATTPGGTAEIFFDPDNTPYNGNELFQEQGAALDQTSALLDTSLLEAGVYAIGVGVREASGVTAVGYAPGRIRINRAPQFTFLSPRDNYRFDRSERVNPTFDVEWTVEDPDSTVSTEVFLDPDRAIGGDEILLRRSDSQTGDSFSFQLSTILFEPGEYNIVAVVNDGVSRTEFKAPGSITLRSRMAGFIDLRLLEDPASGRLSGAIIEGFNPGDNAGSFVTGMEDVDGDGYGEMMILAQFGKPSYSVDTNRNGVGEAYLIYGRADRFAGRMNLNSTGTLFRGEFFAGVPQRFDPIRPSRGITSFALLADWDNDGLREMAFGLPFTDSLGYYALDIDGYFRTGGVVIATGACLRPDLGFPGRQVIPLADIGTEDHEYPFECERCDLRECCRQGFYGPKAYPVSCGNTFFHEHGVLLKGGLDSGLNDYAGEGYAGAPGDRLGCRLSSNGFGDQFGERVAQYDFGGVMISAPNRDPRVATLTNNGRGRSIPGAGVISIWLTYADNAASPPWNTVGGVPASDAYGYGGLPEYQNDGLPGGGPYHYIVDDFDQHPFNVGGGGQVFTAGMPGYFQSLTPPECGLFQSGNAPFEGATMRLWSIEEGTYLSNMRNLSDFNSDGLNDIALGAPFLEGDRGASFIILGRLGGMMGGSELLVQELGLPLRDEVDSSARVFDGVRVIGNPGDRLGQAQGDAGDFNNDGVADVLIGSPQLNARAGGAAIFYGSRTVINLTQNDVAFNDLGDPDLGLGVVFVGEDEGDLAGARVCGLGDVDGDGNDDIAIAAPNRSVRLDLDNDGVLDIDRTNCGVVYLVYGSPDISGTVALADIGTDAVPGAVFVGPNSGSFLGAGLGEQGDRSEGTAGAGDVDGDGFRDLLISSITAAPRGRVDAGETYLIYGNGD